MLPPCVSSPTDIVPSPFGDEIIPLIHHFSPERIFVVRDQQKITQQEFLNDLHRILSQLPDAKFAINLCEDRYYFLLSFCALLLKGTTNLLPSNRLASTLTDLAEQYSSCYCILDKLTDTEPNAIDVAALLQATQLESIQSALPTIPAAQIAAIAFTSGSTGTPKPNEKYFGTLAVTARLLGQRLTAHLKNPTLVATVPSQHMYGLETTIMMALQSGITLHTQKPFFPADVQSVLRSIDTPIVLVTTPTHLRAMVKSELDMPELAAIISATAPLDASLAQESETCFNTQLSEIYGCTEVGSLATRKSTQMQTWQLLDGYQLIATDDSVAARSTSWLGDVGLQDQIELVDAQHFLLRGRGTDMINVAGKRASLSDLSLQLQRIEGVKDAVVFLPDTEFSGKTHSENSKSATASHEVRPVALLVSDRSEKEILAELAERIDAAFIPRPLYKVDALPRSETGKLTSSALQNLWRQLRDSK